MPLTAEDIRNALDGVLTSLPHEGARGDETFFSGVSTDTRTLQPGDLFVALVSDKADGHDFLPQAVAKGAAGAVVSRPVAASPGVALFPVSDTEVAYGQIARAWRDRFAVPIVGVTGSVGKTTTKEMLAAALTPLGPVLKTAASQNNETGVPKALLQLTEDHKAAVIEMGMRGAGQIASLCAIARPTVGVITVIGENHLELLGSRDAIADAKGELLDALPADGLAVLNADDAYLDRLRAKAPPHAVTYSISPAPEPGGGESAPPGLGVREAATDYRAEDVTRTEGGWRFTVRGVPVEVASPSRHDVSNALAALSVADALGVPLADAARALAGYAPGQMRMEVVKTPSGMTVLNDAYNAAPASVRSALETLTSFKALGRRIAFLGDMKELGTASEAAHRDLGGVLAALGGLDALYAVGDLAALIPGALGYFPDTEAAARFARDVLRLQPDDVVLVKGSRAMAMERIVEALTCEH